ncbi:MAG TPA: polymer-forming cytoskeletal protein [Candidatus Acidoferrum sp.]|nr:polymer-forming cytoskeletal protein [Candidatus Acidoferrum sp.]
MWNKQQTQPETAVAPPPPAPIAPPAPVAALGAQLGPRPSAIASQSHSAARLGSSLHIEGHIRGTEDLQVDGKVDGPITLTGHQLIVGETAVCNSEVNAGAVTVYGKIVGNVMARNRVDIKTDGSVVGDISTSRISIEDGAHFKGRIEIDPSKSNGSAS